MALKRVLLVNPTIISHRHARFPLAVMSLSAALEGKYESTIIDGNVDPHYVSTALRAIDDGSVAAVGVTVMGGPQLRSAIALSKAIREKQPAIPIVWGGAFPTVCPDAALNAAYVDYVVRSQGEEHSSSFCRRSRSVAAGRWNRLRDCLGGFGAPMCTTRIADSRQRASARCCPTRNWRIRGNI